MSYQALLFCPDEKTARVVTQVLTELEFSVELCNEPFAMVKKLMAKQYDAIVVDTDNEQNATLLFKSARNSTSNQASLAVAVVEGQTGVAKAFRIGANLVLTKPVNVEQSKGTLRVARGLLRKAEAGKATGKTPAPPSATPSITTAISHAPASAGPTSAAKFAATLSANPPTLAADTSTTSFDLKPDPTPDLDPTEAAFLQSIPDPVASKPLPSAKGSPWLQLSRPAAQGKAASPENDSAKSVDHLSAPLGASNVATSVPVRHPFNTGLSSVQGAGAAAAPAREKTLAPTLKKPVEKIVAPSHPIALGSQAEETTKPVAATPEKSRSRVPLLVALLVIAAAWGGYFEWNKMHIAERPSVGEAPIAAPQNEPPVATSAPGTTPVDSATVPAQSAVAQPQLQQPLPQLDQNQAPPSHPAKISQGGKPASDDLVVVENSAPDNDVTVKVIPVTKSSPPAEAKVPVVQQPLAPPSLQSVSNSSDPAIAKLIAPASVPVLKQPQVLKVSQGITQGMLTKKVKPVYPPEALQLHREGTVQILANISRSGSISSAKVIKGDPMLGQAALAAVKQWKYQPYTLNGQAVDVQTQISVDFKLP